MNITLVAVGKRHDSAIAAAIDDYTNRLQRYAKTSWRVIPPPKTGMPPDMQRVHETRKILEALKSGDTVIVLDERGLELSVPQVAAKLADLRGRASGRIVFVIGGAYGVTDELRNRAAFVWSLSRLVFPHQIVRLLLAEQLYRAFTVVNGEPYHHN